MKIIFAANTFSFILDYKVDLIKRIINEKDNAKISILVPNKNFRKYQENNFKFIKDNSNKINFETTIKRGVKITTILYNAFKIFRVIKKLKKSNERIYLISHTASINISTLIAYLFISHSLKKIVLVVSGFGPIKIRNSLLIRFKAFIYIKLLRISSRLKNIKVIALNLDDSRLINDFQADNKINIIRESGISKKNLNVTHNILKLPVDNQPWKICYVGRYLLEKGIDHLSYIAEGLDILDINYEIVAYGDVDVFNGSSMNIDLVKSKIRFLSPRSFEEIFIENHFLVFPTYREGHPKLILQAMRYGCIPLVYPVPGVDVDIIDGFNGLIAKTISPKGIVSLIHKLNKERYLYQELRNGCKKYIEKISKKDHLGDMLKIILDK